MVKRKIEKSKDGKCPHCGSDNVMNTGKISNVRPASSTTLPKAKLKIWLCNSCKNIFRYQGT